MKHCLVLIGAGHAHAQVLKAWASAPRADVDLIVVSPHALAPYSGMVPGWLSGTYRFDEIVIDFPGLCAQAGARWIGAELQAIDTQNQSITLSNQVRLQYDWLSLNVGSTLVVPSGALGEKVLALRPLASLHQRYETLLAHWRADQSRQPARIVAVGGGAAGVESLLAIVRRLRQERPDRDVRGLLLSRSANLLPGYPVAVQRLALRALREADAEVQLNTVGYEAANQCGDWVVWATGAQPHAWQCDPARRGGLAMSDQGYVQVNTQLQSASHPNVFAVGDCAQWVHPLPKAGVYAVRMGPVLTHNLQAALDNRPLLPYTPQTQFLSLLATADGRAIASRGPFSASGRWAWWLKDYIDRGFIRRWSATN